VLRGTGLPLTAFPPDRPFSVEQVPDLDVLPGG
jgi:hypothetical protein